MERKQGGGQGLEWPMTKILQSHFGREMPDANGPTPIALLNIEK